MPEGPEIHMAAKFINQAAKVNKFGGKIVKSEVSTKNPEVSFTAKEYDIKAIARGKELKVFIKDVINPSNSTHILFRFGMSGCFKFTSVSDLPKHAHLRFFTLGKSVNVLSFVDYRRFGRWEIEGDWGKDRGPDPIFEFKDFSANIVQNLEKSEFNKPICEVLLNQKYFNGIGNYLRAEILYRANTPPFTCAREVLETGLIKQDPDGLVKKELGFLNILELCNIVPEEVLHLDKGKNYDPDDGEAENKFSEWLQCYYVEGMNNLKDSKGRTIWFSDEAGPMKPRNAKVVGRKGGTGSKVPKSGSQIKKETDVKSEPVEYIDKRTRKRKLEPKVKVNSDKEPKLLKQDDPVQDLNLHASVTKKNGKFKSSPKHLKPKK